MAPRVDRVRVVRPRGTQVRGDLLVAELRHREIPALHWGLGDDQLTPATGRDSGGGRAVGAGAIDAVDGELRGVVLLGLAFLLGLLQVMALLDVLDGDPDAVLQLGLG